MVAVTVDRVDYEGAALELDGVNHEQGFVRPEYPRHIISKVETRRTQLGLNTVAEIVSAIDDVDSVLAEDAFAKSEGFIPEMQKLIDLIDYQRAAMGFDLYDNNQRLIVVYEAYRTAQKFMDANPRGTGHAYFTGHLIDAAKIMVHVFGITGVAPILAVLKHDWVEDYTPKELEGEERKKVETELFEELVVSKMYEALIEGFDPNEVRRMKKRVVDMVEGCTKLKKATKEAQMEHTFKMFLKMLLKDLRILAVKGSDRLQNSRTSEGLRKNKGMERVRSKFEETLSRFLPLFRIARFREAVKETVWHCVCIFNLDLYKDFDSLQQERLKERLEPYEEAIRIRLQSIPGVKSISFKPRGIEEYTLGIENRMATATIADLNIGDNDPMFDVCVEIDSEEFLHPTLRTQTILIDVDSRRLEIKSKNDQRFAAKHAVACAIRNELTSLAAGVFKHRVSVDMKPPRGQMDRLTGAKLNVFSTEFGGAIDIVVNDGVSEELSKRGVLALSAGSDGVAVSDEVKRLRGQVKTVLDRRSARFKETAELLSPSIGVYTRNGEWLTFPVGSTVLDFAAALHGDLLLGMNEVRMYEDVSDNRSAGVIVEPTDSLEAGKMYVIKSAIPSRPSKGDFVDEDGFDADAYREFLAMWRQDRMETLASAQVKPAWYLDANARAHSTIANYYRSMDEDDQMAYARGYVEDVARLFAIDFDECIDLIQDRYRKIEEDWMARVVLGRVPQDDFVNFLKQQDFLPVDFELDSAERSDLFPIIDEAKREQFEIAFMSYLKSGLHFDYLGNEEVVDEYEEILALDMSRKFNQVTRANWLKKLRSLVRQRYQNDTLKRVIYGDINPLKVIADQYDVMSGRERKKIRIAASKTAARKKRAVDSDGKGPERKKRRRYSLDKELERLGLWEFVFETPESVGTLEDFSGHFASKYDIPIDRFAWHRKGRGEEPGAIALHLNLSKSAHTTYGFFALLMKLDSKYRIISSRRVHHESDWNDLSGAA